MKRSKDDRAWLLEIDQNLDSKQVHNLTREAIDAVTSGDSGEDICYTASLVSESPRMDGEFALHFMRLLGDQVAIRGKRRLGSRVILDFTIADSEQEQVLFVPETTVAVAIFAPGPSPGPLSQEVAYRILDMVRVICAFALARPVNSPPTIFSSDEKEKTAAQAERFDPQILGLARDHVSLDVVEGFIALGGLDGVNRVSGSLLAYDAALRQSNSDVATILLVTAMEALTVPNTDWRRAKVVARFIQAVLDLCPEAVGGLLGHANVETAFEFRKRGNSKRQRRDLLGQIYDMRSSPVHGGLTPSPDIMQRMSHPGAMRAALLSELYRKMLLAFIQAPRSFLIGHPTVDPSPGDVQR